MRVAAKPLLADSHWASWVQGAGQWVTCRGDRPERGGGQPCPANAAAALAAPTGRLRHAVVVPPSSCWAPDCLAVVGTAGGQRPGLCRTTLAWIGPWVGGGCTAVPSLCSHCLRFLRFASQYMQLSSHRGVGVEYRAGGGLLLLCWVRSACCTAFISLSCVGDAVHESGSGLYGAVLQGYGY